MTDGPRRRRRLFRLPFGVDAERREAEEEIRFHLETAAARLEEEGLPPARARAEAERRFGSVQRISDEVVRTMRRVERTKQQADLVDDARRDIVYAARQVVRNSVFSFVAIGTIALAVGATTAVFSVVDGVLLKGLPFEDSDELVMVWADYTRRDVVLADKAREWLSWPNFADFRDEVASVEAVSAFGGWFPTMTGVGAAQQLNGATVSLGMFADVLNAEPLLGRHFVEAEDAPDGPRAVILSHGLWQRAFGGDQGIVNQTVRLNDLPYTVVGVMGPDFHPPAFLGSDAWSTLQLDRSNGGGRGGAFLRAVGRLEDARLLHLAREQATALGGRLEAEYPEDNRDIGYNVYPLQYDMVHEASTGLWLLLGSVAFVLLIACVNVANLLLARGTARASEIAVRVALGAGRRRVFVQLLTESLMLALLGGVAGVALAFVGTDLLLRLAPEGTPLLDQVGIDGRILSFALLSTLATGLLFGVAPAVQASRTRPATSLREGGRGGSSATAGRLRNALVVSQVALALMLLIGAGLLTKSFQNLQEVDLGFDPESVLSLQVQLPSTRYPDRESRLAFFTSLEQALVAIPGVESAGSITNLPLAGLDGDVTFAVEGAAPPEPGLEPSIWLRRITPDYVAAMGLEVVAGRPFSHGDDAEAPRVIMVNETVARDYFGGDAVGQRLNVNDPENPVWREVVGVVQDIKNFGVREDSRNAMYLPFAQAPTGFMFTAIKTSVDPESVVGAVRAAAASIDPDIALARIEPMVTAVDESLAADRFITSLLSAFALVALVLALVGLYGVISYGVNMRLREMGVRIALGAPKGEIRTLVLRWALGLAAVGIAIGAFGAVGITRLLGELLYGVKATDITTFVAVAALMALAASGASLIPAMRATRVDPIRVLKVD